MSFYLPVAELSVNFLVIVMMGASVGMLSGIFGVGGGFLMTPLLIFIGIPPTVAVGTEASQILAASVSGVLAHWQRRNVDFKMGAVLVLGGLLGSTVGVFIFSALKSIGQIDVVIRLCYVVFLGIIGALMLWESLHAFAQMRKMRKAPGTVVPKKRVHHTWLHGLPLRMRFPRSNLYTSALLPLIIGFIVGILSAIMGVGGGFIMVPAMIYLIGMPTNIVVGTSLFQIIFVTANATFLQSWLNQSVDIMLALMLMLGGVIGAQLGSRVGAHIRGDQLRILLALMVLATCGRLVFDLTLMPEDLLTIQRSGH